MFYDKEGEKMLPEELIRLIKDIKSTASEDNRIELKKAEGGCPKLYDTLSSFSNQHGGGIIVFGIDQDNDFDLCGVYDADDLQKKIASMCRQMTPIRGNNERFIHPRRRQRRAYDGI